MLENLFWLSAYEGKNGNFDHIVTGVCDIMHHCVLAKNDLTVIIPQSRRLLFV